jgi:hypothetical protein
MADTIKTNLSSDERRLLQQWVRSTKLVFSGHAKDKLAERGVTIDDAKRLQREGEIHRLEYRYRERIGQMGLTVFVSDNNACLVVGIPSGVVTTVLNVYNKEIVHISGTDFLPMLSSLIGAKNTPAFT